MIKGIAVKASLCAAAFLLSLSFSSTAHAATITSDKGIAGITPVLDNYYIATADKEKGAAEELLDSLAEQEITTLALGVMTEVVSPYANLGISIADNYVNIRTEPNTESEVVGKLYRGCATDILERVDDWVKIQSGDVNGYIKAEYLAIGTEAEGLIEEFASKYATITTETLYVRAEQSTESTITTMVPGGETFYIIKEYDDWAEIMIDAEETGFVSKEYIDIEVEFEYAISIEEEQAKLAAEEAARQAEAERLQQLAEQQEAARKQEEARKAAAEKAAKDTEAAKNSSSSSSASSSNSSSSSSNSSTGQEIANYAVKFVGNPYVWGGTSLTRGADCSGFVQSIYAHFGYSITRTSRDQAASAGVEVSISNVQPGDLIFYRNSSGVVNHVAMYIGNGKVVHASNAREGIKISSYNYRTPYKARRIIK
jgi:cell wall-associated NlpC family hydrolase